MKLVALEETTLNISELVRMAKKEPVILTRKGKPLATVKPLNGEDWESIALANNAKVRAILEGSMQSYHQEGGVPIDQLRRELGLHRKQRRKVEGRSKRKR